MNIKDFSGGLNTRLHPSLIGLNESVKCENVDLSTNVIKPIANKTLTNVGTIPLDKSKFIQYKGTYISDNPSTNFVEFGDSLYKSNGIDSIQKSSNGTNFYSLGLTKPSTKPTVDSLFEVTFTLADITTGDNVTFAAGSYKYLIMYQTDMGVIAYERQTFEYDGTKGISLTISSLDNLDFVRLFRLYEGTYRLVGENTTTTIIDSVYDISTKSSISIFDDTLEVRQYVYTYYSTTTGIESAPSDASDETKCRINLVNISNIISSTDATVDLIKIYRIGGSITSFMLVDTIPNETTNIYTKDGIFLYTIPNETTYIDTKDSDIDIANGNLLETSGYTRPPSGLKNLTEYNSVLFASIDNTLYFSNPGLVDIWLDINFITFSESITGLGATQNGLLVFAKNKTWILTGSDLSNYTKHLLSSSQGCIDSKTINYVDNNLVWLSLDGLCVSTGGSIELLSWPKLGRLDIVPVSSTVYENAYYLAHTTGILVVDFKLGIKFYTYNLICRGLYYNYNIDKLQILLPSDTGIYTFGTANTYLDYTYRTGILADYGITNYKTYKEIYVYCIGTSTITIYLDGVPISTSNLITGLNSIKLPQSNTKGYYLELEFKGTGTILEAYLNPEGRQNGK